jgi:hypothetical protein
MDAFKEAGKEALRLALISIIPIIVDGLANEALNWRTVAIIGGIALLRSVDKFLHKLGKDSNDPSLSKGLTRF